MKDTPGVPTFWERLFRIGRSRTSTMVKKRGIYADARTIGACLLSLTAFGALLVFVEVYFAMKLWPAPTRLAGTAVAELWAMACLLAGGALGFLFGIPKSNQGQAAPLSQAGKPQPQAAYTQRVNTSLEEVSDWLTKLLLGIGLVQLQKVPELLRSYSKIMGADNWAMANSEGFGIGVIVYFSILGFLGFYLMTRLYLQRALGEAAGMLDTTPIKANLSIQETIALKSAWIDFSERSRELTGAAMKAAKKLVAEVNMEDLESPDDYAMWGKAQLGEANYAETDLDKAAAYKNAVAAYKQASQMAPNDIEIQQEYAVAMFLEKEKDLKSDKTFPICLRDQLMKAYRNLGANTSVVIREKVYTSLTWINLYLARPGGYEEAIRLAEEYNRDPGHLPSGGIEVNLALAYGQNMTDLNGEIQSLSDRLASETDETKKKSLEDLIKNKKEKADEVRKKALDAMICAISLDPTWNNTFVELLTRPDRTDDDLIAFENDNDFRSELGLASV